MTTDNLRADLDALPGVAAAEVTLDNDAIPTARVWLDGTLSGDDVRHLVDELVANSMPSVVLPRQKAPRKRTGLGRGLVELLPSAEAESVPTHLQGPASNRQLIVGVAVIESVSGVTVEIESDERGVHSEPVADDGDIDKAVLRGVAAIVGASDDVRLDVTDVTSVGGSVLLVSAFRNEARSVGAAFVEYGRPYAIARAGIAALRDL
ncbi:MAG: hypothetical protein M3112_07920 [Actinomycetia bacterium]|nr:hypothetical protein [Actinomycetes bacterium]